MQTLNRDENVHKFKDEKTTIGLSFFFAVKVPAFVETNPAHGTLLYAKETILMRKYFLIILLLISPAACTFEGTGVNRTDPPANSSATETANKDLTGKVSLTSSPDVLSAALTLLRQKKESIVRSSEVFKEEDGVRLNISMVEKGHLQVLYKGSNGETDVLFPDKKLNAGRDEVEANKNITIPTEGWFFFDEKSGTENVYAIFSKNKSGSLSAAEAKRKIELLEKRSAEEGNAEGFLDEDESVVRIIRLKHR
jgi:hypothetical protein